MEEIFSNLAEIYENVKVAVQENGRLSKTYLEQMELKYGTAATSENNVDKTPKQKKLKKLRSIEEVNRSSEENIDPEPSIDQTTVSNDDSGRSRSRRVAKAISYKEPTLNEKLRRADSIKKEKLSNNSTLNISQEQIKQNKFGQSTSKEIINSSSLMDKSTENKRKAKNSGRTPHQSESDCDRDDSKKVKLGKDDSCQLLQVSDVRIEIKSDDDEKDIMPPPNCPPVKTRKPRTKKNKHKGAQSSSSSKEIVIPKPKIKEERISSLVSTETTSKSDSKITENSVEFSKSVDKSKLRKNLPQPILIENFKTEISDIQTVTADNISISTAKSIANTTAESVYEDAISDNNIKKNEEKPKEARVLITKLRANLYTPPATSNVNLTYTETESTATPNEGINNATFKQNGDVNDGTFVLSEKVNHTVVLSSENRDSIITEDASILTEDDSLEIAAKAPYKYPLPAISNSNKRELFNPHIQSPVKKKVEAFEMIANCNSSPRITRTKSRVKCDSTGTTNTTPLSRIPKAGTQSNDSKLYKYNTPKDTYVTTLANQLLKKKVNSSSKLAHVVQQPAKSSSSRENSVEDLKRGALQLQSEEKKKLREEKQKLAQLHREIKEKERVEQTEKAAREREEKYKRLMQEKEEKLRLENAKKKVLREKKLLEAETRKKQEEMEKQAKTLEQQSILDNQKRMEKKMEKYQRDLAEIAKLNSLNKQFVQKNYQNSPRSTKKPHDFEILLSGDSTDEEEKQTTKRPPPPSWSMPKNRMLSIKEQTYLQTKFVDNLFSVKPMTADLREIFPAIDEKYLKRNSSVLWSTPPRYSELPKY